MATRKPKTIYFDNYPLREKIGKANFTLKLKNGGDSLRFTPEQFGKGLQRDMRQMISDLVFEISNSLKMQEIRSLTKKDREVHFDWVLEVIQDELRKRKQLILDQVDPI